MQSPTRSGTTRFASTSWPTRVPSTLLFSSLRTHTCEPVVVRPLHSAVKVVPGCGKTFRACEVKTMWQNFQSLQVQHNPPAQGRRRYSVTTDILAYQQCSIQYGAFVARRYAPALVVQLFYGTIIHQVLDRAHAHYRGELGVPPGTFPTDADIDNYFMEVENALIARRIRAVQSVRDQAKVILKRFNSLEGPTLYPRIIDTECRLQADQGQYILHGNVDVLVASDVGGNAVEIWDYKGAHRPS